MSPTLMAVEDIGRPDAPRSLGMFTQANEEFLRAGDEWVTPLEQHDIERAADRARALLGPDAYAAAEHAVLT